MKKLSVLSALALAGIATPALAHHPLAGAPMETFEHGVLSGIGHPLLGFDHLFFVAAMGIAALFTGRALIAPLGYLAAMAAGVMICFAGIALPMVEIVIALSLLAVGGLLAFGRSLKMGEALGLFALIGLFHGWAFGESLAAQEAVSGAVLSGYLLGLVAIQYAVAVGAGLLVAKVLKAAEAHQIQPRLAGAFVAGIGGFLVLESLEGAAFAALGLG